MTSSQLSDNDEIAMIQNRLSELDSERSVLEHRLTELVARKGDDAPAEARSSEIALVTGISSPAEKITLFRSLFRGRGDVFPKRWTNSRNGKSGYAPVCANEWVPQFCRKPKIRCGDCSNRAFVPLTDSIVSQHLRGADANGRDFTIGVYPMLVDESCWFLAADFDKTTWQRDVAAFLETCRAKDVSAALERSRSGNGGHVWIFFSEPVSALLARCLGALLLTETMEQNPDIGFESYDRFFPNQDTMPAGGLAPAMRPCLRDRRESPQMGARSGPKTSLVQGDFSICWALKRHLG